MSDYKTTHLLSEEIDRLRLKAFATNDPSDRKAYFEAASLYFQERHERAMNRADRITALEEENGVLRKEKHAEAEKLERAADVRKWYYYPIEMPLGKDGQGPATVGVDAVAITYEVWDVLMNTHASFDNLPDAINESMRLNNLIV